MAPGPSVYLLLAIFCSSFYSSLAHSSSKTAHCLLSSRYGSNYRSKDNIRGPLRIKSIDIYNNRSCYGTPLKNSQCANEYETEITTKDRASLNAVDVLQRRRITNYFGRDGLTRENRRWPQIRCHQQRNQQQNANEKKRSKFDHHPRQHARVQIEPVLNLTCAYPYDNADDGFARGGENMKYAWLRHHVTVPTEKSHYDANYERKTSGGDTIFGHQDSSHNYVVTTNSGNYIGFGKSRCGRTTPSLRIYGNYGRNSNDLFVVSLPSSSSSPSLNASSPSKLLPSLLSSSSLPSLALLSVSLLSSSSVSLPSSLFPLLPSFPSLSSSNSTDNSDLLLLEDILQRDLMDAQNHYTDNLQNCSEQHGNQNNNCTSSSSVYSNGISYVDAASLCGLPSSSLSTTDAWANNLIIQEELSKKQYSPFRRSVPPPMGWSLLCNNKIAKRVISVGEGTDYPTRDSNATIIFSLHMLDGFKLTDTKQLDAEMMEFPIANAIEGLQQSLMAMHRNERSLFVIHPSLCFSSDFEMYVHRNETAAAADIRGAMDAQHSYTTLGTTLQEMKKQQREQLLEQQYPEQHKLAQQKEKEEKRVQLRLQQLQKASAALEKGGFNITATDWLIFDIKLASFYGRNERWWSLGPDSPALKDLPEEQLPEGMTYRDVVETKTDIMKKRIEDEMEHSPTSSHWENLEGKVTEHHHQQATRHFTDLREKNDLSLSREFSASRGYVEQMKKRGCTIKGGYVDGGRMQGTSSVYMWYENNDAFEVLLLIRKGIRRHHVSWDIKSNSMIIYFNGLKVLEDNFLYNIDPDAGATWSLTDAATLYPPMPSSEIRRLWSLRPLLIPKMTKLPGQETARAAAFINGGEVGKPNIHEGATNGNKLSLTAQKGGEIVDGCGEEFVLHPHTGQMHTSGRISNTLLEPVPEEAESINDLKDFPAIHMYLPKARGSRGMWGSCFLCI